jgi:hypothetical protein
MARKIYASATPPSDKYTRRVSVEMSDAEWEFLQGCAQYVADANRDPRHRDAAARANRDGVEALQFQETDFSRLFL